MSLEQMFYAYIGKAWQEHLHPRDRKGQFRDKDLGIGELKRLMQSRPDKTGRRGGVLLPPGHYLDEEGNEVTPPRNYGEKLPDKYVRAKDRGISPKTGNPETQAEARRRIAREARWKAITRDAEARAEQHRQEIKRRKKPTKKEREFAAEQARIGAENRKKKQAELDALYEKTKTPSPLAEGGVFDKVYWEGKKREYEQKSVPELTKLIRQMERRKKTGPFLEFLKRLRDEKKQRGRKKGKGSSRVSAPEGGKPDAGPRRPSAGSVGPRPEVNPERDAQMKMVRRVKVLADAFKKAQEDKDQEKMMEILELMVSLKEALRQQGIIVKHGGSYSDEELSKVWREHLHPRDGDGRFRDSHAKELAAAALTLMALAGGSAAPISTSGSPVAHPPSVSQAKDVPAPTTARGYAKLWASIDTDEWGGGDVSLSVPLPDGRSVWMYGDTFSGNNGMVHSSAITQDGGKLHVSHGGKQLLPNDADGTIYWIEDGQHASGNKIRVTAAPMTIGDSGPWDFKRARTESRVAVVHVDSKGDVTFGRWAGYVKAPPPFNDFAEVGPHHYTYEKRAHPEIRLASGSILYTVNQNWDDDISNHMVDGHLRYEDFRPLFIAGQPVRKDWNEALHPRDKRGRFREKGQDIADLFQYMNRSVRLDTGDFDKEGGFSIHRVTGNEPEHGAMCSVLKQAETTISFTDWDESGAQRVMAWLNRGDVKKSLRKRDHFIGGWVENGMVYLDVSKNYPTLREALAQARSIHEIGVFNLDDPDAPPFSTVRVGKSAGRGKLILFDPASGDIKDFIMAISRAVAEQQVAKYDTSSLQTNPGKNDNWIEGVGGQLPSFVRAIAHALMRERGIPRSRAIGMAIGITKRWAAGGGDVTPKTRAKAAKTVAEWEKLKAKAAAQ